MLPARHRLRNRREVARAIRGRRAGHRLLVVHLAQPAERHGLPPRAGLAVGRVVGNAVTRNRVKRVLRAQLAPLMTQVPDGTDLVVRAQPAITGANSQDVAHALVTALQAALRRTASRRTPGAQRTQGATSGANR